MSGVSVVIRVRDEAAWLDRSLKALALQDLQPEEVILVDHESQDDSAAIGRRHGCRIVPIRDGEFTYGRALNRGIEHSRGRFLVCLSAHCIPVHNRWLEALLLPLRDPRVAAVYGRQIPFADSTDFDKRDLWTTFGPERRVQEKDYFFHNANSVIRRACWERWPFDETLSGVEDREWARTVISEGGRLVYEPLASVYHHHGIHQGRDEHRAKRVVKVIELIHRRPPRKSGEWVRVPG